MTPPAPRPHSLQCVVITCGLLCIWSLIIVFSVITWVNPPWMQELSRAGRTTEASALSAAGVQRLRDGDYEGSIAAFQQALEVTDDPQTRVHLAIAYARAGEPDRALELLQQSLANNPSRALRSVILYNIGDILVRQPERIGEAAKYYQESLEYGAEPDKVYGRLGQILYAQNKPREALAAFEKSLEAQLDPTLGYRNMLQRSLEGFSVVETADVEADAATFSEKDMERYDVATINEFQTTNNPDLSITYNWVGGLHARLGEAGPAHKALKEALRIWPKNRDAAVNLKRLEGLIEEALAKAASTQSATAPASQAAGARPARPPQSAPSSASPGDEFDPHLGG